MLVQMDNMLYLKNLKTQLFRYSMLSICTNIFCNMLYLKNLKTQLFSRKATQGDLRTGVHTHVLK